MELYLLTENVQEYETLKFLQPIEGIVLPPKTMQKNPPEIEKLIKECRNCVGDRPVIVELQGNDYAELLDSAKEVEAIDKLASFKVKPGFHGWKVAEYYHSQTGVQKNIILGPISSPKEALEAARNHAKTLEITYSSLQANPKFIQEIQAILGREKFSVKIMISGIQTLEEAKECAKWNSGIILSAKLIQQAIDEDMYFN